jgi:uncharacterized protein
MRATNEVQVSESHAEINNQVSPPQQENLPHGFTRRQIALAISPKIQELILLPTEKCNFRCTYCYEDFELGKMSETTQVALERFIERRIPDLNLLKFSWFGGEPLVAKDVVLRLARFAKEKCDAHGVTFSGGLTTNAYILDAALARELIELHQDFFQITLDGWQEGHDALRKRADGRGTFDTIWHNLKQLRSLELSFEVVVRVHVRRDNQENLEILMKEYAKEFFDDKRFRLDFQHLRDMGGEGGKSVQNAVTRNELPLIEKRLRQIVLSEVYRLRGTRITAPLTEKVTDATIDPDSALQIDSTIIIVKAENSGESAGSQRASEQSAGAPYICYAGKPNSLLIRSNGRIGKCTVAFDDDRNDIGYLDGDGKIVINHEKLAPWYRGLEVLDTQITGCPVHNMPLPATLSPQPQKVITIRAV